jgi:hypothetical protein
MKNLTDVMAELPAERRARVESRAEALIAEETTLRDLRRARELTQERMRLEGRADMLLSTLRSYVAAMGGSLDLVVRFPDRPAVSLSTAFGAEPNDRGPSRRGRSARRS